MTTDDYINRVLSFLPRHTPMRAQIAVELRGHIEERLAHGQTVDDVLRQLGDPALLAESYLSAVPLEPASFPARARAKLLDIALVVAIVTPPVALSWFVVPGEWFPFVILAASVAGGFGFCFYTILAEYRTGQTLGKRVAGLQVVRESGAPIGLGQAIVRLLPMTLQIFWIDVLFALFTDKRQRAFEMLSKTRVVRARSCGHASSGPPAVQA
jgi:uncharacterized RDD family membrane protein YckC